MKKAIAIAMLTGLMVSCAPSETEAPAAPATDTTKVDTAKVATPTVTTNTVDTTKK